MNENEVPLALTAADFEQWGDFVREIRESRGLSLREAARQIGVVPSVLFKMEAEGRYGPKTVPKVLRWMARPVIEAGAPR